MITNTPTMLLVPDETQLVTLMTKAFRQAMSEENNNRSDSDKVYSINQVAKRFGKAHRTIKRMVKCGTIKATKSGLISESAINNYLNNTNNN